MRRRVASSFPLALALTLASAGCGGASSPAAGTTPPAAGHEHGDGHGTHHDNETGGSEALVPWKDAVVGDRTTCPVSQEEFVVTEDSARAEHEGHTYYFCCAACLAPFRASPARYLNPT